MFIMLLYGINSDKERSIKILNNNNWIEQSNKLDIVNDIDYGDGMWVAVGDNPNIDNMGIQLSIDGSNWIDAIAVPDRPASINCVKYGNGQWFVGFTGSVGITSIMRSSNAINWYREVNNVEVVRKIDYGNNVWAAVGTTPGQNRYTIETIIGLEGWGRRSNALQDAFSIKYANNLWIAGGYNEGNSNTTIQTSVDTLSWTSQSNNLIQVNDIDYHDDILLSVGCNSTNSNQCIQTSPDGSNWTPQTASVLSYGQSIGYSNGVWIVGGLIQLPISGELKNVGVIEYSYDTINWTSTFITSTITKASTVVTGISSSIFVNNVPIQTTKYIPSNPDVWQTWAPSTINDAIDRLAVYLSTYTNCNIPLLI